MVPDNQRCSWGYLEQEEGKYLHLDANGTHFYTALISQNLVIVSTTEGLCHIFDFHQNQTNVYT